jgi:putative ABC transport system permease protein
MKFLGYIFRNVRRNKLRSFLTIGSIASCGFLAMILLSIFSTSDDVRANLKQYNRVISMSSQGFAQSLPIALRDEIVRIDKDKGIDGIVYRDNNNDGEGDTPIISPFSWYGGKYAEETSMTFAQFGVDPDTIFDLYVEYKLPPEQLEAFKQTLDGVVIGRKLASDKKLKVGDKFPLKGVIYEFDMDLTVVGIYDGPEKSDLRTCYFNWNYLNEGLKSKAQGRGANNAGTIFFRCKNAAVVPTLCKAIDDSNRNSDRSTKTQTEDAFAAMFSEMLKDLQTYINMVGLAVAFSLVIICGVSMAMSLRERTNEVAVLRAIGFRKPQILFMVLAESVLIAAIGGLIGTVGTKLLFDVVDISPFTMGFFPFFYVPWFVALVGLAVAVAVGLFSGVVPALRAASLPVIDGLRKVV